jgi:hypothetical protein
MTEQELLGLIEQIEMVDSQIWSILLKQAYVMAVSYIVLGILLMFLGLPIFRESRKLQGADKWFAFFWSVLIAGLGCILLGYAYRLFSNPEFYVIKWLLAQL